MVSSTTRSWACSALLLASWTSSVAGLGCGSHTTNDPPSTEPQGGADTNPGGGGGAAGRGGSAQTSGGATGAGGSPVVQPICHNQKGFYEDEQGNCRRFRPCDDTSDCNANYVCTQNERAGHDTCEPIATCEVPARPDPDVICASISELANPTSDPYPRAKHPERLGDECPPVSDVEFAPDPPDACRVLGECGPVSTLATDGSSVCCYAGPSRCGPPLP